MIAADRRTRNGRLLAVDSSGAISHLCRDDLGAFFEAGDVIVANDAATWPASLAGKHEPTGTQVEIRLAGYVEPTQYSSFMAVVFGAGDHRTPTEVRPQPPTMATGDRLILGPLIATVEHVQLGRLLTVRFDGTQSQILAGIARHGRPIQYAHVPDPLALWDVWTTLASVPYAFEAPSAGFALDWKTLDQWIGRGVEVATLTHAAGISSTGDAELDAMLPFDEPYFIPNRTAEAIESTRARGGRVVAIGTTVVRALEAAATADGGITRGAGLASGRIGPKSRLTVVNAVLSGIHEPGESHYELLRAFTNDSVLRTAHGDAVKLRYRNHEFGDSLLIQRRE